MSQVLAAKMTKKNVVDTDNDSGTDLIPAVHVAPLATAIVQARAQTLSCHSYLRWRPGAMECKILTHELVWQVSPTVADQTHSPAPVNIPSPPEVQHSLAQSQLQRLIRTQLCPRPAAS